MFYSGVISDVSYNTLVGVIQCQVTPAILDRWTAKVATKVRRPEVHDERGT